MLCTYSASIGNWIWNNPMVYQHLDVDGESIDLPVGKVVCVGRNYVAHARELGNAVPAKPVLFMKPATALVGLDEPLQLPTHGQELHHEVELAVLLDARLCQANEAEVGGAIAGYGVALDFTLRDLQARLKADGQPWELAKAFDGSCPLSAFAHVEDVPEVADCALQLWVNGKLQQDGNTRDMIVKMPALLAHISQFFTLEPGDVVLTGTPAGVGPLQGGEELILGLGDTLRFPARMACAE